MEGDLDEAECETEEIIRGKKRQQYKEG